MTDQLKILLITFIIIIVLIYIAPNAESAMILITAFWGFIYLNNALFDYKEKSKIRDVNKDKSSNVSLNEKSNEKSSNVSLNEKSSINEQFNNSNLDSFTIDPEFYYDGKPLSREDFDNINEDTPNDKLNDKSNEKSNENSGDKSLKTDQNHYNPDLEYTPDKIGYMRNDMEYRTHQNEAYSRCYKPLKGETNDCNLYESQPIDERMSEYWRQVGYRGKKLADGVAAKSADYFRAHYNTELERSEKKVWWETENIY